MEAWGKAPGRLRLLAAGAIVLAAIAQAALAGGDPSRIPEPRIEVPKGKQCVADPAFMRRNHMKLLLRQREETVRQGLRGARVSLKGCVDCHADPKTGSVLGQDGFCQSCHSYAAVKIDCFECHSSRSESRAAALSLTGDAAAPEGVKR